MMGVYIIQNVGEAPNADVACFSNSLNWQGLGVNVSVFAPLLNAHFDTYKFIFVRTILHGNVSRVNMSNAIYWAQTLASKD